MRREDKERIKKELKEAFNETNEKKEAASKQSKNITFDYTLGKGDKVRMGPKGEKYSTTKPGSEGVIEEIMGDKAMVCWTKVTDGSGITGKADVRIDELEPLEESGKSKEKLGIGSKVVMGLKGSQYTLTKPGSEGVIKEFSGSKAKVAWDKLTGGTSYEKEFEVDIDSLEPLEKTTKTTGKLEVGSKVVMGPEDEYLLTKEGSEGVITRIKGEVADVKFTKLTGGSSAEDTFDVLIKYLKPLEEKSTSKSEEATSGLKPGLRVIVIERGGSYTWTLPGSEGVIERISGEKAYVKWDKLTCADGAERKGQVYDVRIEDLKVLEKSASESVETVGGLKKGDSVIMGPTGDRYKYTKEGSEGVINHFEGDEAYVKWTKLTGIGGTIGGIYEVDPRFLKKLSGEGTLRIYIHHLGDLDNKPLKESIKKVLGALGIKKEIEFQDVKYNSDMRAQDKFYSDDETLNILYGKELLNGALSRYRGQFVIAPFDLKKVMLMISPEYQKKFRKMMENLDQDEKEIIYKKLALSKNPAEDLGKLEAMADSGLLEAFYSNPDITMEDVDRIQGELKAKLKGSAEIAKYAAWLSKSGLTIDASDKLLNLYKEFPKLRSSFAKDEILMLADLLDDLTTKHPGQKEKQLKKIKEYMRYEE